MASVAVVATLVLVLLSGRPKIYRPLVREDSVLEWAQVATYASVVVVAAASFPRLLRERPRSSLLVLGALAVGSLLAIGEETSWGQRLIEFETPDALAENRQGEANLHNHADVEPLLRLALVVVGAYGLLAALLVRRRSPLAPPRSAAAFYAVVVSYFAFRLLFLERPTYVQAKFSEWPELCFAIGAALWCLDIARRHDMDATSQRATRGAGAGGGR